ncbi:GntP family permease [Winogradskyella sp.]|uniref:GntP family permease n=1 Tax=Winogradskyella sp. TaxID=1883156 RepID=UPI003BAAEC85
MVTGVPLLLLILLAIVLIVVLTAKLKWHPFLALVLVSVFLGKAVGMEPLAIIEALKNGFGGLLGAIGLIIIFGSIIGTYLERSGGALRIAQWIVSLVGKNKTLPAVSVIGAVISIPVFCDSGFILLSGLTDKLSKLSNASKASLSLALATGLYTTHTLVPPTPGPIAAASILEASSALGVIIVLGIGITIPVLFITQLLAKRMGNKLITEDIKPQEESIQNLPSLSRALLPLFYPILLIALGTGLDFTGYASPWLTYLTNPTIAIFQGALLAMVLLKPKATNMNVDWVKEAIQVAGPILVITAAGGAFGGILKATPLADEVASWMQTGSESSILVLVLCFVIALVLKTAQGSSTSAMVITASLLAPLLPVLGWQDPIDFALAVMAIGGGAMMVSHYNDSYFWVVSQFSGLSAKATSKSFSLLTVVQGLTVLILTLILSLFVS